MTYIPVPMPIPNLRKKVKVFMRGKVKLQNELDIVSVIKAVRQNKILTKSLTTRSQRVLMQFQKSSVVHSDTMESSEELTDNVDMVKKLRSKNPWSRVYALGKINK